jgi:putative spermidine/putrescine transport system ATP-binding protein
MLADGEQDAVASAAGIVREVAYLGSVTRYVVELDGGETLVVLKQNLDMSAATALEERGRRVRLAWREEDATVLDTTQQEVADS